MGPIFDIFIFSIYICISISIYAQICNILATQ